jgi:hypothetical protein
LQVIGLNPSTANEETRNRTVTRIQKWGRAFGSSAFCMTKLFAFQSTHTDVMRAADTPIGPKNERWLDTTTQSAGQVIAAWENGGEFLRRAQFFVATKEGNISRCFTVSVRPRTNRQSTRSPVGSTWCQL